jgi:hypothetical protein
MVAQLRAPGVVTNFGRPPYGATNATVNRAYAAVGMQQWLWGPDTKDYLNKTQAQVVAFVVAYARPGDTVLMHMGWRGFTPAALLQMRAGLAAEGIGICRSHVGTTPDRIPGSGVPC